MIRFYNLTELLNKIVFYLIIILSIIISYNLVFKKSDLDKRNQIINNHDKIKNLLIANLRNCNQQIYNRTVWGNSCKGEWEIDKLIHYIKSNFNINNPYREPPFIIKHSNPKIKAFGLNGNVTERGNIFISSHNLRYKENQSWVIATCFKSPCLVEGNTLVDIIKR